jgi:4-amino-4-deoxy-L-arabinose transferase-like glycosyltransferase
MTQTRRDTWLFWLFALLILGTGLGLRDPWPADEPRFALVAKQMVESGDWLFPHRGSELYSDKPPLFMWLQAAFLWLTGNLRIAFLLPSLLAALGTLWCVTDLGARLWTRRIGLYAGWAVLLTIQFTWQAKKAQIDPLVVFWITLSCYGLLRHALRGPDWRMWALGWAAAGLGTISKGVGVIALLMLLPIAFASLRGWPGVRLHARSGKFWLGPLAFLAACGVWLVPMLLAALGNGGPDYRAYVDDILLRQTVTRYANAWHHGQPPWYFIEVALTAWLPTMLALPWAIPAWRRRLQPSRYARYLLPLAWVLLVFVFFSIPSGKRDMYILPALPMLCLALAPLLPGILRKRNAQRVLTGFVAVFSLALLGAGLAMLFGEPGFERRFMEGRDAAVAHGLAAMFVATGAVGIGALLWCGRRRAQAALVAMLATLWVLYSLVGAPLLNDGSSSRGLMREVGTVLGPDAQLGLVGWREQQLLMADRPAKDFGFKRDPALQFVDALAWQRQAPSSRWLLVEGEGLPACVDKALSRDMGNANRRRWWLLPAAATRACR